MPIHVRRVESNIYLMQYQDAVSFQEFQDAFAEIDTLAEAADDSGGLCRIADMSECTMIFEGLSNTMDTLRDHPNIRVHALVSPPRAVRLFSDLLRRVMPGVRVEAVPDIDAGILYCRDTLESLADEA